MVSRWATAELPAAGPSDGEVGQATLDALADSLAVLDDRGEIVAVNAAWRRFANANGGGDVGIGSNYLAVCDRSASTDLIAGDVAGALRDVLDGTRSEFATVYPCHAPWRQRWFAMRVTRFSGPGGPRLLVVHHETTERHLAETRSHDQAGLLGAVDAAIVAVDLDGIVTYWSRGAAERHGWAASEAIGKPITSMLGFDEALTAQIAESTYACGHWDGSFEARRRDGTTFPAYVRACLQRDRAGRPSGLVAISVDMTEPVALQRELTLARDFLTTVTQTMPDGLIVVDAADRITLVNEAAETMLGWSAAELLGKRKHQTIHAPPPDDDCLLRRDGSLLAVSSSAAPFTTAAGDAGSLLVFGDITETKARELAVKRELEALSWVGRIRDALDDDRFLLHAQPIVDVTTGATVQHELLVRMIGPRGKTIAPGMFLPVAEEHGLIQAIDRRVLELALPYATAGHRIEINLSGDFISDPQMLRHVRDLLADSGADPRLVVFEITETALIPNEAVAQRFITDVRALGCGVALDDFGTGFGSFRYLKHLPVDLLKIDQDFVRDLGGEGSDVNRHVIEAIVTLARGMGQRTIAEGVETQASLAILRELGVDFAQGFLFARPRPAVDVFSTGAG